MNNKNVELQDVIYTVLIEEGRPLLSREITDIINQRSLFHPYGSDIHIPVTISEVNRTIKNYPKLFSRETYQKQMLVDVIDKNHKVSPLITPVFNNINNNCNNEDSSKKIQNIIGLIIIIIAAVFLLAKIFNDRRENNSSINNNTNINTPDYSWLNGAWEMKVPDETIEGITFHGGTYSIIFVSKGKNFGSYSQYFRGMSEHGSYSVSNDGEIKLDAGDGFPSYFWINGNRIKDNNGNYLYKRVNTETSSISNDHENINDVEYAVEIVDEFSTSSLGNYDNTDALSFGFQGTVKAVYETITYEDNDETKSYTKDKPTFAFDKNGRITIIKEIEFSYNSNGKVIEKQEDSYGNQVTKYIKRDANGRIISYGYDYGDVDYCDITLKYDEQGRIIHKKCSSDSFNEEIFTYNGTIIYPSKIEGKSGSDFFYTTSTEQFSYHSFDPTGNWTECELTEYSTSVTHEPGLPETKTTNTQKKSIKRRILYY